MSTTTSASLPTSIGWIGLGLMGDPMARNLLAKMPPDTRFFVYDVVSSAVENFVRADPGRVTACGCSREVGEKSDVVLSMVPEGSHVRAVYLTDETGVLAAGDLGSKVLVDCSTIDTGTSLAVAAACRERHPGVAFYDAPVSGGVLGAQKATLTFMLGCAPSSPHLPLLTTLLPLMGPNIFPCGAPSLGLTAKLCNNYLSGTIAIATSEALAVGIASGMDPRVLANVFHTSTAQSAILDDWCPVPGLCPEAPASRGYAGGFRVGLMRKDYGLAVEAAGRVGVGLALGGKGLEVYTAAMNDEKCRDLDSRVVYRYLGGREDWRDDFPEEVAMRKDETREALRIGREVLARRKREEQRQQLEKQP